MHINWCTQIHQGETENEKIVQQHKCKWNAKIETQIYGERQIDCFHIALGRKGPHLYATKFTVS